MLFCLIFSSHTRFRKKCLLESFLPVNLDNQQQAFLLFSFELELRLKVTITGAYNSIGDYFVRLVRPRF